METDTFFVENLNTDVNLKLYVAVLGYFVTDPVPGGCGDTDEFLECTSPYMKAIYNRDYIYVDIASAKYNDTECSQSTEEFIQLRFFMLYLPEQNHDSDVYFEGIKSMMTLNNILRNGRSIPRTGSNTRRMLSAYLGTGVVYVAVANPITNGSVDESKYSIYVPTTSYGCAPAVDGDCEYMGEFYKITIWGKYISANNNKASLKTLSVLDLNITIPLNKTTTFGDKQLYGEFITLNRTSKLQVNFSKGKDLAFIIFQVHSHLYNITLYKNVKTYKTSVSGTNVGLHSGSKEMESDTFFVENWNADVNLKLYVAVLGYFVTVPISPYMKAIYNRDYIYVDIAPAKYNDPECSQSTEEFIQLRFFMLYLPEQSFDSDVYFEGIKSMMTLNNILRNGRSVSDF
ncbi:Transmembrane 7 superfamily member [Operophtera brumata]|uniref:Transmembrane 7 superfamily member n=1 Tax=Operophtera brumata TaxID=104452 RepID=A0A0L7KMW2_OPEBR|nr:Transmembrane 7 superfamily member [Operophtera brumata]